LNFGKFWQGVIDRIARRKMALAGGPSRGGEFESRAKEQAAAEEAMKKSEEATGWREHNGFADN
jgi:hypothetical protein